MFALELPSSNRTCHHDYFWVKDVLMTTKWHIQTTQCTRRIRGIVEDYSDIDIKELIQNADDATATSEGH